MHDVEASIGYCSLDSLRHETATGPAARLGSAKPIRRCTGFVGQAVQTCPVRSETWQLATKRAPFVLLTGDSGTGKTSVLQASQTEHGAAALAPPPTGCMFDSGALQVALLDALSAAMALHDSEESGWRKLGNRITHASRETALEMGKSLRDALVQELLNLVKSRLGQDVGKGLLSFLKGLRSDDRQSLRRDIRSRSDGNVVRLLVRLADEVADTLNRDIVIALDDADRLSDADQRILASVAAQPPQRVRVIVAYSTVKPDALAAIDRLRALNCPEVIVGGLSRGDVDSGLPQNASKSHCTTAFSNSAMATRY